MANEPLSDPPNISGVPEEIKKNIIKDLDNEQVIESKISKNARIGLSVSENEELGILGFSRIHLEDLTIEIVRHLLINNITLLYGGDLRREGYTELFSDLAYQYRTINDSKKVHFINYFSYPIYCQLTKQNELDFKRNRTDIIRVRPPVELQIANEVYLAPNTLGAKYIWAKSLTKTRQTMIENSEGRILVGGKCDNYLGKIPGIVEEAKITLECKKPLYLIGALGGASLQVINALKGNGFDYMNSNYHKSKDYKSFRSYYNEKERLEKINNKELTSFFSGLGTKTLSDLNGLSIEENERLYYTQHISEILFYVFKGLNNRLHL